MAEQSGAYAVSTISDFGPKELSKWRGESARAAKILKVQPLTGKPDPFVVTFVFNDMVVNLPIAHATIAAKTAPELANMIYEDVLTLVKLTKP